MSEEEAVAPTKAVAQGVVEGGMEELVPGEWPGSGPGRDPSSPTPSCLTSDHQPSPLPSDPLIQGEPSLSQGEPSVRQGEPSVRGGMVYREMLSSRPLSRDWEMVPPGEGGQRVEG